MASQKQNFRDIRQQILAILLSRPVIPLRKLSAACGVNCIKSYIYPKESDGPDYKFPIVTVITHNRNKIVAHANYRNLFSEQDITTSLHIAYGYLDAVAEKQNAAISEAVRNSRGSTAGRKQPPISRKEPPTLLTLLKELNQWPDTIT